MAAQPPAQPNKPEQLPNGSVVAWDHLLRKYAVFSPSGDLAGYRYDVERARKFASSLPVGPPPPPPPTPLSRSPRARPLPPQTFLPTTTTPEAERSFFPTRRPLRVVRVRPR
jgi:hypothetical protein